MRKEFEPDLQVAAVHIKFGNLVLLQKFDEFSQILNILFLHSFLGSPPARTKSSFTVFLKLNQGFRRRSQHLPSAARHSHHILNANAKSPAR